VLSRVINLPFRVLGKAARAVQQAEAARQAARGEAPAARSSAATLERSPLDVPPELAAQTPTVPVAPTIAALQAGEALCMVDVRGASERERVPGALHMPDDSAVDLIAEIPAGHRIVVFGDRAGRNARRVAAFLRYRGLEDCAVLEGGFAAWKGAGGPTEGR